LTTEKIQQKLMRSKLKNNIDHQVQNTTSINNIEKFIFMNFS